jgi:hypothetical protein
MAVTLSELRANIFKLVDQVIETGVPLEILRNDTRLRISLLEPARKLDQLPLRNLFACDPDELVQYEPSGGSR